MKIKSVSPSEHSEYFTVCFAEDGVKCLTVTAQLYGELGSPGSGEELGAAEYEAMLIGDMYYRAVKRALSILSYADNSRAVLIKKLTEHGIEKSVAQDATEYMVSLGYIDEKKQLARLVLAEANGKLSGPSRIVAKLSAKGYSASDIRAVMRELRDAGEVDFNENLHRLVIKKCGEDYSREDVGKIKYKYGY